MIGRFAEKTREIELEGSRSDMRELALRFRQGGTAKGDLNQGADPSPYDMYLKSWTIVPGTRLLFSVEDATLVVRGGKAELALLADNLEVFAQEQVLPSHLHMEFYPDHPFLSEDSLPVVFSIES